MLLRREANAYDNDENDKDDKNDASRPDDDKVPEVRSRLKLDGILRAEYLFSQIDPKMVSDDKRIKRHCKYRIRKRERKSSNSIIMNAKNLMFD